MAGEYWIRRVRWRVPKMSLHCCVTNKPCPLCVCVIRFTWARTYPGYDKCGWYVTGPVNAIVLLCTWAHSHCPLSLFLHCILLEWHLIDDSTYRLLSAENDIFSTLSSHHPPPHQTPLNRDMWSLQRQSNERCKHTQEWRTAEVRLSCQVVCAKALAGRIQRIFTRYR